MTKGYLSDLLTIFSYELTRVAIVVVWKKFEEKL